MKLLQAGSPADVLCGYLLLLAGPMSLGLSVAMEGAFVLAALWSALGWLAWTSKRMTGVGFLSITGYLGCALTGQPPELALMLTGGTLMAFGMSSVFEMIFELYCKPAERHAQQD